MLSVKSEVASANFIDVIQCPICKAPSVRNEFTSWSLLLGFLLFPLGMFIPILWTKKHCDHCGYKA